MPIYAYRCRDCGFTKDVLQKLRDEPLTQCPSCGKPAFSRQLSAPNFQLKGSGWYVTDFRDQGGNGKDKVGESDSDNGTGDKAGGGNVDGDRARNAESKVEAGANEAGSRGDASDGSTQPAARAAGQRDAASAASSTPPQPSGSGTSAQPSGSGRGASSTAVNVPPPARPSITPSGSGAT